MLVGSAAVVGVVVSVNVGGGGGGGGEGGAAEGGGGGSRSSSCGLPGGSRSKGSPISAVTTLARARRREMALMGNMGMVSGWGIRLMATALQECAM